MKRDWMMLPILGLVMSGCADPPVQPELPSPNFLTLTGFVVSNWAPVILQDVDAGILGENDTGGGDHIARFDFDGNWNAWDNWTNGYKRRQRAYVYTTFVESDNFYFLTYNFFHAADWCQGKYDLIPSGACLEAEAYHENDFEGAMFIVDKNSSSFRGDLLAIITHQHTSMNVYLDRSAELSGRVGALNQLQFDGYIQYWNHNGTNRPALQIEARGHGVFAAPDKWETNGKDNGNFPGGDGAIYWYRGKSGDRGAEIPTNSGRQDFDVAYDLLWLDQPGGLWERRYDLGVGTPFSLQRFMWPSFDVYGGEIGSRYIGGVPLGGLSFFGTSPPKPPWAFDVDGDTAERGNWIEHPIGYAMAYLNLPGIDENNEMYVYNPYCPCRVGAF